MGRPSSFRAIVVLASLASAVTACSGGGAGGGGGGERAVAIRVLYEGVDPFFFEETAEPLVFEVIGSSGNVVTSWDGTLALAAERGGVSPVEVEITDGVGEADVFFEAAAENALLVSGEGLADASQYFYGMLSLPSRTAGSGTGGAVIDAGPGWDAGGVWAPAAASSGGSILVWYTGAVGTTAANIGLATSPDGVTFTKETAPVLGPGVAVDPCHADGAEAPSVIAGESGGWIAFYAGRNATSRHLCRATSPDGRTWTVTPGPLGNGAVLVRATAPNRFDNLGITGAAVARLPDGSLVAFFSGTGTAEVNADNVGPEALSGIGLARSEDDGLSWTRDGDAFGAGGGFGALFFGAEPVTDGFDWDSRGQYGPSVLVDGDVFRLYLSGISDGGRRIGYRVTDDIENWVAHVDNLTHDNHEAIPAGEQGAFDDEHVEYPSVLATPSGRRIFWTGRRTGDGVRRIGVGTFDEIE